jgi:hypothetical protein
MVGPQSSSEPKPSCYLRAALFTVFFFGFAFADFIGSPQQTSSCVSQPHSSHTVTASPHKPHTSFSPFFTLQLLPRLQLQQQQPPALLAGASFGFIGFPQQLMLHSLQEQGLVTTTSAPQFSQK